MDEVLIKPTGKAKCVCGFKHAIVLFIIGVLFIVCGVVLRPVLENFIQKKIDDQMVLKAGSKVCTAWLAPGGKDSVPMYAKFYLFDVKNYLEVHDGAKPVVEQKGPYSYRTYKKKENVTWFDGNSTVAYNEKAWYVFDPATSCGTCQDPKRDYIHSPNMPMIILAQLTLSFDDFLHWREFFSVLFDNYKEKLFMKKTVHEVLFGYGDPIFELYLELKKKYPILSFLPDINPVFVMQPNNTYSGLTVIHTGARNIADLEMWVEWRGKRDLGLWKSKYANMINGSDGNQFPPGTITADTRLYLFTTQLCRSLYVTYDSKVTVAGIEALKFTLPATVFVNNSNNKAFCPYECYVTGILDSSGCKPNPQTTIPFKMRSPILASAPHFYHGDPSLVKAVVGLKPDSNLHETYFSIERHMGIPVDGAMRLQLNAHIQPIKDVTQTEGLQEVILPIMYFSSEAKINSDNIHLMKRTLLNPLAILHAVEYAAICIGGLLIFIVLLIFLHNFVKKKKKAMRQVLLANSSEEHKPLLINSNETSVE